MPRPSAWTDELDDDSVEVLPLVDSLTQKHEAGWCTYVYEHLQAPELEVFCGGVNSKTPKAGAVWRQGNLLHFGFEQSPAQLNDTGQSLLVNAIAYIARFAEDRPLVRTPCVFVSGIRIFDRDAIDRWLHRTKGDLTALKYYVTEDTYAALDGKSHDQIAEWFVSMRDYIQADEQGKLMVDEDARAFGVSPTSSGFLEKAIASLAQPGPRTELGRRLLARYVPEGPASQSDAEQWRRWWLENKPYLFFSDTGGYRWYVDRLAKARGIPTGSLRGPARATLPTQSSLRQNGCNLRGTVYHRDTTGVRA